MFNTRTNTNIDFIIFTISTPIIVKHCKNLKLFKKSLANYFSFFIINRINTLSDSPTNFDSLFTLFNVK